MPEALTEGVRHRLSWRVLCSGGGWRGDTGGRVSGGGEEKDPQAVAAALLCGAGLSSHIRYEVCL